MRRGVGFVEAVIAMVMLALVTVPLVDIMIAAGKTTSGGNQRAILELRARRHQAEIATTTYDTALSVAGQDFPIQLGNPADQDGHGKYLQGIHETTQVAEVEPGLMESTTLISWDDVATHHVHEVKLRRFYADPAHALKARYTLTEVQ